jgi:hypothetical protein
MLDRIDLPAEMYGKDQLSVNQVTSHKDEHENAQIR